MKIHTVLQKHLKKQEETKNTHTYFLQFHLHDWQRTNNFLKNFLT